MAGAVLIGRKLYLRPLSSSDVGEAYVSWLNDPDVTRYLETGGRPTTADDIRDYLRRFDGSRSDMIFAIVDQASSVHIGNVTLNHIRWAHGTAETGLMIGERRFWGRGYATEAWWLLIDHAFRGLGLRKVIAGACSANAASIAVLRKLGFQLEGTLRGEFFLDGEHLDVLRFGILGEDLIPRERLHPG